MIQISANWRLQIALILKHIDLLNFNQIQSIRNFIALLASKFTEKDLWTSIFLRLLIGYDHKVIIEGD